MRILIPIGISGSGKSKLYKENYSDMKIISPDLIRFELTGDISNQSVNDTVFKIVNEMVDECVKTNTDFYYDATNINTKYRKRFVNQFEDNKNVEIWYLIFPANVDLSYERIQNDIKNNVNRSDVPKEVIDRQYQQYKHSLKTLFKGEHVSKIIYQH